MKAFRLIVLLMLLGFTVGWFSNVYFGNMSTRRYAAYYMKNLNEMWVGIQNRMKDGAEITRKPIVRPHVELY